MTQRTSFAKLQRDRDKQAKAAAKRDRRQERQLGNEAGTGDGDALEPLLDDSGAELTAAELLKVVETVHRQFEEGVIDFETFEQTKSALLSRLLVD
jgi:hypothetical protein